MTPQTGMTLILVLEEPLSTARCNTPSKNKVLIGPEKIVSEANVLAVYVTDLNAL